MANEYQKFEYYVKEAPESLKPRIFKLVFLTGVASPVFTGKKIIARGGGNEFIGVILVDNKTHQKVISGPAASAKVKIDLLPGSFGGSGDGGIWTPLEFEKNIIINLKNKKNILLGDLYVDLKHGSGIVGEIRIKHDRNYQSKGEFRLGAKAIGFSDKVKEAISDPFEIKDGRNELTSKNRPLLLTDKVWQLKNIDKKGSICKRLEKKNVKTVNKFLDMLSSNPQALQKMYGSNGKKWEKTVRHAKTCVNDNVGYNVHGSIGSTSQQWNDSSFVDEDDFSELNVEPYKPYPYEDGLLTIDMIVDQNLSIHDFEECEIGFPQKNLEPCQVYQEDGTHGASTVVCDGGGIEGVMAKKRWIKLCHVWFSIVYITKIGVTSETLLG